MTFRVALYALQLLRLGTKGAALTKAILPLVLLIGCSTATALSHMGIELSEFQQRRQAVMNAAPNGITLVHSFSAPKSWQDPGFQQDANFYYLTGLENLHDAILAIDGTTKETWLFVMTPTKELVRRFETLSDWDSVYLTPSPRMEQMLGIAHIVTWDDFADFIETRHKADSKVVLYLDQGGPGSNMADVSNPHELNPIENPYLLWTTAIRAKWPDVHIANAAPILLEIRAVKSPAEVALMKQAALYTDAGFRAAIAAIAPGRTNREIEGAAIAAALREGADGVGMWPEIKSGPVSGRTIFQKNYDYYLRNRTVQTGETVLMDIAFSHQYYKGDVGRTLPVSGHFTRDQREVIDLMNGAYRSGLQSLHDGVRVEEITRACGLYVESHRQGLRSESARRAAAELCKPYTWIIYTHGLDMVEIFPLQVLHTGNTVAIGPEFDIDGVGFYEEDVVLITADGYQLINPALPYSAADLEKTMKTLTRSYPYNHTPDVTSAR